MISYYHFDDDISGPIDRWNSHSYLGTEIPVYPKTNDQNHFNDLPLFIVRIQEQPHSVFQRNRLNLIYTATIDLLFVSTSVRSYLIVKIFHFRHIKNNVVHYVYLL